MGVRLTADLPPLPGSFGVTAASGTSRSGSTLIGGSPRRRVSLTATAADVVRALLDGATVMEAAAASDHGHANVAAIARRLVETGLAGPRPTPCSEGRDPGSTNVAAVIPAHNAATTIAATIAALHGVDEIVVVDDGSTDDTGAVARTAGARVLRHDHPRGPAAARNAGIGSVTTDIVVLLDSDAVPAKGWLAPLLAQLTDDAVGGAAPRIVPVGDDTVLGRYEAECGVLDRGTEPAWVRPDGAVTFVSTTAMVVRRDLWVAAGGFDEGLRFGEDLDFVWRAAAAGRPIVYEPAALVHHHHRPSLRAHLVNRCRYGTASGPLSRRHAGYPRAGTAPRLLAAAAVTAGLGLPGLTMGLGLTSLAQVTRRLATAGERPGAAMEGAARATARSGRALAAAVSAPWLPIALTVAAVRPRSRWPLLGAVGVRHALACVQRRGTEHRRVGGAVWVLLRVLEDLALSVGVIKGCLDATTIRPMGPGAPDGPVVMTTVLGRELILP